MNIIQTKIEGCFQIFPEIIKDTRGCFVKTFQKDFFKKYNIALKFEEEYYTVSKKNVLRGLHFQLPPKDYKKMVYSIHGVVFDAILDLRTRSTTYGKYEIFKLDAKKGNILYLPSGIAHGFYVLSSRAVMCYKVTAGYSNKHDTGILWNSAGIPWPCKSPITSQRDAQFESFDKFKNPFIL